VRGSDKSFETVSDANGAYVFADIPGDNYKLEPVLPEGWRAETPEFKLPTGSCFEETSSLAGYEYFRKGDR